MATIGIRELRNDLSNQVRKASQGEVVVITIGGEPKAKLTPLPATPVAQSLEQAYETGRIIKAPRSGEAPPPPPEKVRLDRPSGEILKELREDRF